LDALEGAHAAIDISDGLLADAAHLARASAAMLVIDEDAVIPSALTAAVGPDTARRCALGGGEDYEILATAPSVLPGFFVIGRVEAATEDDLRWADGRPVEGRGRGWDHGT
jgi:thiamine-monophosphate kinase